MTTAKRAERQNKMFPCKNEQNKSLSHLRTRDGGVMKTNSMRQMRMLDYGEYKKPETKNSIGSSGFFSQDITNKTHYKKRVTFSQNTIDRYITTCEHSTNTNIMDAEYACINGGMIDQTGNVLNMDTRV